MVYAKTRMPLPRPVHKPSPATVEDVAKGSTPSESSLSGSRSWLEHFTGWARWCVELFTGWILRPRRLEPFGLRLVLISDTHGRHRDLKIPDGDLLIHAGDFTRSGLLEDAEDFNAWLKEQPHSQKIVINGNHECNADWKIRATDVLSNATLLRHEAITVPAKMPKRKVQIHGTDFFWPMSSANPYYDAISEADVLLCHGPVKGYADGGKGCTSLLKLVQRLRPRLVVSGHIHFAHAVEEGRGRLAGTTFVNAANARGSHTDMGWEPVVVDI